LDSNDNSTKKLEIMTIQYTCEIRELVLENPFGLSRGTRHSVNNLFLQIEDGLGEGAPIYYHGQNVEEMKSLAESWLSQNPDLNKPIETIVDELFEQYPNQSALIQAIDLALHDKLAKGKNQSLSEFWGIDRSKKQISSFTIGLDSIDVVMEKVEKAHNYPILKIKVGCDDDMKILEKIHQTTKKPIYIDANEGWSVEESLERFPYLKEWNVHLLEQPLPRNDLDGYEQLFKENPTDIPIIIDEGVQGPDDIETMDRKSEWHQYKTR
jgi:L-alanine-DL-glutamate epimerase-like enolase superfamily enzyme